MEANTTSVFKDVVTGKGINEAAEYVACMESFIAPTVSKEWFDFAEYAKNPTGYCFIAGTLVVTFLGLATIDSIQEGDYVLAKDMDTGVVSYQPVIDTFVREVDETYTITIDGVDIEATTEHPFYCVKEDAFIPAKDLESGDTVETADGDTATVDDVTRNDWTNKQIKIGKK